MKKIMITTDSASDLNNLYKERNVGVFPLFVNLGPDTFIDGVTINPNDIYAYVEKVGELPKTAARSPEDALEFFKPYVDQGFEVVHISISKEFSLMHESSKVAAGKLKGVYVVDSRNLSTGIGLSVLYACDLRDEGKMSAQDIAEAVAKRVDKVQASFVVSTMDYLHKGGRCSGLSAFAATALMIKPSIYVQDGKMHVGKKYFPCTFARAVPKYVNDVLRDYSTPHRRRVSLTHTSATPEILKEVRKILKDSGKFDEIIEGIAGSTITSHCGKGTLGILYYNDGE